MAIEEASLETTTSYVRVLTTLQEFSIEIPDKEADAIHSGTLGLGFTLLPGNQPLTSVIVDKAVDYILAQPDGTFSILQHLSLLKPANYSPAH